MEGTYDIPKIKKNKKKYKKFFVTTEPNRMVLQDMDTTDCPPKMIIRLSASISSEVVN